MRHGARNEMAQGRQNGRIGRIASLGHRGARRGARANDGRREVEADVLFSHNGRTIAIELQRSYQHLRDFTRRQERYKASGVEWYWLVRLETFRTPVNATGSLLLKRDYGNKWPEDGIGTGSLPELPVECWTPIAKAKSILAVCNRRQCRRGWMAS